MEHKGLHKSAHEGCWCCAHHVRIMVFMNCFALEVFSCLSEGCAEPGGSDG